MSGLFGSFSRPAPRDQRDPAPRDPRRNPAPPDPAPRDLRLDPRRDGRGADPRALVPLSEARSRFDDDRLSHSGSTQDDARRPAARPDSVENQVVYLQKKTAGLIKDRNTMQERLDKQDRELALLRDRVANLDRPPDFTGRDFAKAVTHELCVAMESSERIETSFRRAFGKLLEEKTSDAAAGALLLPALLRAAKGALSTTGDTKPGISADIRRDVRNRFTMATLRLSPTEDDAIALARLFEAGAFVSAANDGEYRAHVHSVTFMLKDELENAARAPEASRTLTLVTALAVHLGNIEYGDDRALLESAVQRVDAARASVDEPVEPPGQAPATPPARRDSDSDESEAEDGEIDRSAKSIVKGAGKASKPPSAAASPEPTRPKKRHRPEEK